MSKLLYSQLEKTLAQLGSQVTAAEVHGLMTGMASLGKTDSEQEQWRDTLLENLDCTVPTSDQWQVLLDVNTQTAKDLERFECDFNLLLPNDDNTLDSRVAALGLWCRGYLSGLGLIGITDEHLSNEGVKELVQDLSQIAHISIETDASEEDEENYMELVEYVRIAVQNIQAELTDKERMLH